MAITSATMLGSPDGQWIAYESDKSDQRDVYLTPYPGPGGKEQASMGGGARPRWSSDGSELFFRAGRVRSCQSRLRRRHRLS